MCTVTATELKRNFGKYMEIAKKEKIQVTHRGKNIFVIIPEKEKLLQEWELLFGCLPKEAAEDKNVDRE